MSQQPYYAVIDIGSNTIRLVIYKMNAYHVLFEEQNLKYTARLRSYLDKDNTINKEGINQILTTLHLFQTVTRSYELSSINVIATAAIRQAKNRDEIVKMVEKETDYHMTVLSEKEEAYYGYLSVIQSTNLEEGYTIDIGGGSTEITYMENRKIKHYHSFPFGALTLQQEFIHNDKPTTLELEKLNKFVCDQFREIPWIKKRNLRVVGIGGSARNLSQIHQKQCQYPLSGIHHYEFPSEEILGVINQLKEHPLSSRKKVEGLSKERADIIIPAIQAIFSFTHYVKAPSFLMCRKGLREGYIYETLISNQVTDRFPNITEKNIEALSVKYNINNMRIASLKKTAFLLAEQFNSAGYLTLTGWQNFLQQAAQLNYLGDHIESESVSQHTFYILSNTALNGMNHKNRIILALLASFKNKSTFKDFVSPYVTWFTDHELEQFEKLGAILKFSYFLNTTNRNVVDQVKLMNSKHENKFTLKVMCHKDFVFEKEKCEKHVKHLERAYGIEIELDFQNI
ncbi:Ppx/GppA family phosphatase [Pseudalkalibacillus hwajinpoensis]|uniref:Ppx/GppA family phosphatase n=1 Tax=Guptibacillus hwajinpoensis TaxID=208199 RepID=UPI00325BAC47